MTKITQNFSHWTTDNGKEFFPAPETYSKIEAAHYKVKYNDFGYYLEIESENKHSNKPTGKVLEKIIKELDEFWGSKQKYKKLNFIFKKGILIHGTPGNGKGYILNEIIKDGVKKKRVVIEITEPEDVQFFLPIIRKIEKDREFIFIIKNLGNMIDKAGITIVSEMFNSLSNIENSVYIVTLNVIEKIKEIIYNCPSAFDNEIKVCSPTQTEREKFIKEKIESFDVNKKINVKKWAKDTNGFSVSNLKHLIISVFLNDKDYEKKLKEISKNKDKLRIFSKPEGPLGFTFQQSE